MVMQELVALGDVAHHILKLVRERVTRLFVSWHGAHVHVHSELARAGEDGPIDQRLSGELAALGLGPFLGGCLQAWMSCEPNEDLRALLLASSRAHSDALSPLEWQQRAHAAIDAVREAIARRIQAANEHDRAELEEVLEAFCSHGARSLVRFDPAALRAHCTTALWSEWLADRKPDLTTLPVRLAMVILRDHPDCDATSAGELRC